MRKEFSECRWTIRECRAGEKKNIISSLSANQRANHPLFVLRLTGESHFLFLLPDGNLSNFLSHIGTYEPQPEKDGRHGSDVYI